LNLIRWAVAAIVFGALATSLADAGTRAGAHASRHGRHHHQTAGPVPVSHAGNGAAAAPDGGSNAGRQDHDPNGADAAAHNGARVISTMRDHPGFVGRASGAHATGTGRAAAQHDINPDLIFVPPPGRNAKYPGKLAAPKRAVAARPAVPTAFRRQGPDPGAVSAAKNAIGVATKPNASSNPTGAARTGPGRNPLGDAGKTNAIGAHIGPHGVSVAAPGGAPKAAIGVGPANAGHPGGGPNAVAALSTYGGSISGTGLQRPGTAPGVIGGPAKVIAGIGGTGMRPKR
jgi:hypothetical protein